MPKFRGGRQSALHCIAMQVAQFFDAFAFRPHVEVVEAFLPDGLWSVLKQSALRRVALMFRLCQIRRSRTDSDGAPVRARRVAQSAKYIGGCPLLAFCARGGCEPSHLLRAIGSYSGLVPKGLKRYYGGRDLDVRHCAQSSPYFVLGLASPQPARTSFLSTDRTSSLLMSTFTSS
jgi:hypothetical protein